MITETICKHEIRHRLYNAEGEQMDRCIVCGHDQPHKIRSR